MRGALLRVGIDSGCGGIQGPIFAHGEFEYVPIPEPDCSTGRTFGNTLGTHGRPLIDCFPAPLHGKMRCQPIHFDPEFVTCTYGNLTGLGGPKAGLRKLRKGDLLVFYCVLQGWGFQSSPALYLMGYLEVLKAGLAPSYTRQEIERDFANNAHLQFRDNYPDLWTRSILVKGSVQSRLLRKAVRISTVGKDRSGRSIKVLSPEMQNIFGDFGGRLCVQRSPTRWVDPLYVNRAAEYVRSLD